MRDIENEEDVKFLVDLFYKKAGRDGLLGPIFSEVTAIASHKKALHTYWSSVLLSAPSTDRQDFPRHIEMMFTRRHFIRWLDLFLETIDRHYAGVTAEKAKVMVIRKSEEFQSKLELSRF